MIFNPATGEVKRSTRKQSRLSFFRGGWHGWANKWVRGWPLWTHFRDFFPIKMVKTADLDPQRFEQADIDNSTWCEFWRRKNVSNAACMGNEHTIYSIVIETTSNLITTWYCAGTIFCVPILTESSLLVRFAVLLLKELISQRWAVLSSWWFSFLSSTCLFVLLMFNCWSFYYFATDGTNFSEASCSIMTLGLFSFFVKILFMLICWRLMRLICL